MLECISSRHEISGSVEFSSGVQVPVQKVFYNHDRGGSLWLKKNSTYQ